MTMPNGFQVVCDECAVTLKYSDVRSGFAVDLTPDAAEALGQELIDKARDCRDANELEQMQS